MVYLQVTAPPIDTWRVAGRAAPRANRKPARLIFSSRADQAAVYSPDGRRIAFDSGRSGGSNVWVCDSDGKNAVQLTTFEAETGFPSWSPDGRRILFSSNRGGVFVVYVVNADGTGLRALTDGGATSEDARAVWSPDGSRIVFTRRRGRSMDLWTMPVAG